MGYADKEGLAYNYRWAYEEFKNLQTRVGQVSSEFRSDQSRLLQQKRA